MKRQKFETLVDVYDQLRAMGVVSSTDDFSTNWLGMNKSYLRCVRAKGTDPSAKVLAYVVQRLRTSSLALKASAQPKVKAAGRHLAVLAERCADEIFSGTK